MGFAVVYFTKCRASGMVNALILAVVIDLVLGAVHLYGNKYKICCRPTITRR